MSTSLPVVVTIIIAIVNSHSSSSFYSLSVYASKKFSIWIISSGLFIVYNFIVFELLTSTSRNILTLISVAAVNVEKRFVDVRMMLPFLYVCVCVILGVVGHFAFN